MLRRLGITIAIAVLVCHLGCSRRAEEVSIKSVRAAGTLEAPSLEDSRTSPPLLQITAIGGTDPVSMDADDPTIWVCAQDPTASLIIGTNKSSDESVPGSLVVFNLAGKQVQEITGIARPNNVDLQAGFRLGKDVVSIVATTERYRQQLRLFVVDEDDKRLREVTAPGRTTVFYGEDDDRAACMGVGLYRRPADGEVFAIVSRKSGPAGRYLWQYRLVATAEGEVALEKVREFGRFSGQGEIEAVAVDDELGFVYYADEEAGVRKYHADPDAPEAHAELSLFATEGFEGDREGIAILDIGDGHGFILCTDQIKGGSRLMAYSRTGEPRNAHDHSRLLAVIETRADDTDGIEIAAGPLGPVWPHGLMVCMNSSERNFLLYDAGELVQRLGSL